MELSIRPSRGLLCGQSIRGFTILEPLLAGALLLLLTFVFVVGLEAAQTNAADARMHERATFLASEGLEAIRSIRDSDFSALTSGTYGLSTTTVAWELVASPDETDGLYTRSLVIEEIAEGERLVVSTVEWTTTTGYAASTSVDTVFTDWQH